MKLLGPRGPLLQRQPIGPKGSGGEQVLGNPPKLEAKYMRHCLCLLSDDRWHARALDMLKLVPVIPIEVHTMKSQAVHFQKGRPLGTWEVGSGCKTAAR